MKKIDLSKDEKKQNSVRVEIHFSKFDEHISCAVRIYLWNLLPATYYHLRSAINYQITIKWNTPRT